MIRRVGARRALGGMVGAALLCAALALSLAYSPPVGAETPLGVENGGRPQRGLPEASVTITDGAGRQHVFAAEVVDTPRTRSLGMMFRTEIGPDEAMLFIYERPQEAAFWMRNTLIPLDIIFITAEGRIWRIHENAIPHDETPLPSNGRILSVLEIAGGRARALGLRRGDVVTSMALSPLWRRMRGAGDE